ncbi:hypothetical protein [Archangium violaceum]|uniref:Uncharacterized protein n=1 Tax=Archangium violaceum Cb vi76 TaxID=1406225 RepID=A0A084SV89_9BACT|nr:hypothetical protein [Archangium violaceum]KFA92374.1 hypothetical protein Q664_15960 [Archangium violaceum Cb vi76]
MSENTTKELAGDSDSHSENQDSKQRVLVHRVLWAVVLMLAVIASFSLRSSGGATIDLNGVALALMWCCVAAYLGLSSRGLRSESMSSLLKTHGLALVLAVPAGVVLIFLKVFLLGGF